MNKTDDIDLLLTLRPHGWSTCWIHAKDKMVEITISHIFGDPYYDFMKALMQLIDKKNETSFFWYGEPGGEKVELTRLKEYRHMIEVKVNGFDECFGEDITRFEQRIEFVVKEKQLITLAYYQLKKIENLLQEKSFAATRGRDFPFRDFVRFEKKVIDYLEGRIKK